MIFFMDHKERVYARYGGRDSWDADNRQTLDGLRYTMESVAKMHARENKEYAPKAEGAAQYIRDVPGSGKGGKCMHCHQVKERLDRNLVANSVWTRDMAYRYPLPENLGFRLEVKRGNVVEKVTPGSTADKAGLKPGDLVTKLGATPIHSFGDATYSLDKAPRAGTLPISFTRDKELLSANLTLAENWRKTDISWRPSARRLIPSFPLSGDDLKAEERKKLGLTEKQLAFRQGATVHSRAKEAGIAAGDIITDVDARKIQMPLYNLYDFVRREYLVGDTLRLTVLRDGKSQTIPLVLGSR
jgi:predicted metalloprotease with PDZ domain